MLLDMFCGSPPRQRTEQEWEFQDVVKIDTTVIDGPHSGVLSVGLLPYKNLEFFLKKVKFDRFDRYLGEL